MLNYHTDLNAKATRKARKAERKAMERECKVYKGLNTKSGYDAAPKHIRECWDFYAGQW